MRVNGLFGWVERNNRRSVVLLLGFNLLMQPLAAVALSVPLLYLDPAHAPWHNWAGYALRYVPAVTLAAGAWFAMQMWWHLKTVRKDVGFRFVDDDEEPRLCALVETLSITAGVLTPFVGIIDSPAMNAFACGVTPTLSAVVFTRGIVDGLDDDELSAVVAHELVHLRNGDARLVAAANTFVRGMTLLDRHSLWKPNTYRQIAAILFLPGLFLVYAGVALLSQLCLQMGFVSRILISSAREFVADAEAVRITQHPSAFVSALQRIQNNSHLPGLAFEQDAMMIDGMTQGRLATHPPIVDRIQAIAATTGQMALDARPRRDTRGLPLLHHGGFGRKGLVAQQMPALERAAALGAVPQAAVPWSFHQAGGERQVVGLRWDFALALVATFGAGIAFHHGDLRGVLGPLAVMPDLLASAKPSLDNVHACQFLNTKAVLENRTPADDCDAARQAFNVQAKAAGVSVMQDGRLLSPSQVAMLSPGEIDGLSDVQRQPTGGFMLPLYGGRPAPVGPATDLMPSYPLPVNEAWQRLAQGSLAPFMRALQCGLLVHAHTSAYTNQSVTWSITSESVERIRFTATLTPDGPDRTVVTLDILDLQEPTLISDGSKPSQSPFPVVMLSALKPPFRPFFAEAMTAMLERRSFEIGRVMSPPTSDEGARMTADICSSHWGRLSRGERFSVRGGAARP